MPTLKAGKKVKKLAPKTSGYAVYDEVIRPHLGQILVFLWNGISEAEIIDILGFDKKTWESCKANVPDFILALKMNRDTADAEVEYALYCKALKGDTTAAVKWLSNRKPERWGDRKVIEHTGSSTIEIKAMLPDNGRGVAGQKIIDVTSQTVRAEIEADLGFLD